MKLTEQDIADAIEETARTVTSMHVAVGWQDRGN